MDIGKIAFGPKFKLDVPQGELSDEGQAEILELLQGYGDITSASFRAKLPDDWSWEWKVAHGTYAGTLSKRIQSFVYKTWDRKLTDEVVTAIGNKANQHTLNARSFIFDFDHDLDWKAGDFGDNGSCFWSEKTYVLPTLQHFGGLSVRLYSQQPRTDAYVGVGRALILPWIKNDIKGYSPDKWSQPDGLFVFNGYGKDQVNYGESSSGQKYGRMQVLDYARLLALFFGVSYQRVRLAVNSSTASPLYVNNDGNAILVGPADEIGPFKPTGPLGNKRYNLFDVKWSKEEMSRFLKRCENCEKVITPNGRGTTRKEVQGPDGRFYCESCLKSIFIPCGGCGNLLNSKVDGNRVQAHALQAVPGQTNRGYLYLCGDCRPRLTFKCVSCRAIHHVSDKTDYHIPNGGRQPKRVFVCPSCARDKIHVSNCPSCSRAYPIGALVAQPAPGKTRLYGACPQCRYKAKKKAAGEQDDEDTGVYLPLSEPPEIREIDGLLTALTEKYNVDIDAEQGPKEPVFEGPLPELEPELMAKIAEIVSYIDRNDWRPTAQKDYFTTTLPRGAWELSPKSLLAALNAKLREYMGPTLYAHNIKVVAAGSAYGKNVAVYMRYGQYPPHIFQNVFIELVEQARFLPLLGHAVEPGDVFLMHTDYLVDPIETRSDALMRMFRVMNEHLQFGWPKIQAVTADFISHDISIQF